MLLHAGEGNLHHDIQYGFFQGRITVSAILRYSSILNTLDHKYVTVLSVVTAQRGLSIISGDRRISAGLKKNKFLSKLFKSLKIIWMTEP